MPTARASASKSNIIVDYAPIKKLFNSAIGVTCASMSFSIDSVVRGHHIYKCVWTPEIGEKLQCQIESYNIHDMHAVAVELDGVGIVGVPFK